MVPEEYEIAARCFFQDEIDMVELTRQTHEIAARLAGDDAREKLEALYTAHRIAELRLYPVGRKERL